MLCYNLFSWPTNGLNFIWPSLTVLLYISSSGNCLLRPVHISLVELLFACTPKYSHCCYFEEWFLSFSEGQYPVLKPLGHGCEPGFFTKTIATIIPLHRWVHPAEPPSVEKDNLLQDYTTAHSIPNFYHTLVWQCLYSKLFRLRSRGNPSCNNLPPQALCRSR